MRASTEGAKPGTGWRDIAIEMITGLREAVWRFPVPALLLFASTLQAHLHIAEVHWFTAEANGQPTDTDLIFALSSGALAALAATLFGEARILSALTRTVAAFAFGIVVTALIAFPHIFLTQQWTMVLAVGALVPVAPFIGRGDSRSFWVFSVRVAFASLLGLLVLLFLAGGISAILVSLSLLFGLTIPDDLYQHIWAFSTLFAAPLFAIGQLPSRFDETPAAAMEGLMERGMRALGDYIVAPLLILYAVILHLYAVRIILTGEMPQGQIGWLVLVYGLCIFAALLLINPFFDRARAPTRLFLRLWPFFLPVPLLLLFYALMLRIGEFGLTPDRYLLALFGLASTALMVLQVFPSLLRGDIRLIAALPALALFAAGFGPQGAFSVSISSQAARFLQIVENPPLTDEQQAKALAALSFLAGHNAVERVAPEGMDLTTAKGDAYVTVAEAWNLDPTSPRPGPRSYTINNGSDPKAFSVEGFDTVIMNVFLDDGAEKPVSVDLPSLPGLSLALDDGALIFTAGEESIRFPISNAEIERLARLDGTGSIGQILLEAGKHRIALIPSYLYADIGEPPQLHNMQTTILLRGRDWR
ncbi:DUF4153 domain-containing protein [Chelativorans sp. Marseille-P2723]|uniref:DUF4153 domain-containing protein n=1 Tax=Chelativorans sp. Marseille-P2723 TaxID=2709133 RepID=UPI00156F2AF8|nr:DUF4153 domain-containing protein [Chelativorans sp. Marseille-P2723]